MRLAGYDATTPESISWEYIKRNKNYYRDKNIYRTHMNQQDANCGLFPCAHQTPADLEAVKWGLLSFADPQQHMPPFWHPELDKITIEAEALNTDSNATTPPLIPMLRETNVSIRGLHLLDGRLCLSISSKASLIQLMFPPGTVFHEYTKVLLRLPYGLNLPIQMERAKALWEMGSRKVKENPSPNLKHYDFLVALDGYLAGKSLREIAIDLYSCEYVDDHWMNSGWLKNRIRRRVKRGRHFMEGGYMALLA